MKKYISIIAAIAAVSFAVSCAKDITQTAEPQNEEQTQKEEVLVPFEFTAEYPDMDITRTTVTDQGEVAWAEGDRISIYYLDNNVPSSTVAIAQGSGKSVKFSASIPAGVTEFYAVYPEGKGTLTTESVFTVKTDAACNGEFQNANIAAAYAKAGDAVVFKFKNVTGLFKIQLPEGAAVSHAGESTVISSIEITGKADELVLGGDVKVNVDQAGAISFATPTEGYATSVKAVLSAAAVTGGYAYIPVLPFTSADGVTFKFEAADATVVPALLTKAGKSITLERGHIKPVEKALESIVWDWYFSPEGTGDGKTASTPAGVETFEDMLNATSAPHFSWQLNGAVLHLGEGTYALTKAINVTGSEAGELVVEGAGKDLSLIDGAGIAGTKMFTFNTKMNITFKNLTVQNGSSSSSGGAVSFANAKDYPTSTSDFTSMNVKYYKNSSTGGNSGALYLGSAGKTTIIDSEFEQNTAKTQGGAFSIGGQAGNVQIKGTTFTKNKVTADGTNAGGAIYDAGPGLLTIENSFFVSNSCTTQGGAIKLDNASGKLFVSGSHFESNIVTLANLTKDPTKSLYGDFGGSIYSGTNKGVIGCYNCTFHYNHSLPDKSSSSAFSAEKYVVANCTMVESVQVSYGVISNRATSDNISTAVNNILLTTSTNNAHPSLSMSKKDEYNHITSAYNVLTRIQDKFTAASADVTSITGKYKATLGLTDSSAAIPYFAWDGTTGLDGFTKCTLADVEAKIKANTAIGAEFWNWLVSIGATDVDVRGVQRRNTDAMWPGSYQQD